MSAPRVRLTWPKVSLRWRLVLLVLGALLPGMLLLLYHAQAEREGLIAVAQSRALRLARAWAENHDALVREADFVLLAAQREPALREGADGCDEALRQLAMQSHWGAELAVIDAHGALRCASTADGVRLPPRGYVDELFAAGGLEVSEFRLDTQGRSIAFAGMRLPDADRKSGRAVIAMIDLAEIQQRTAREAEGARYDISVVDRTGLILARDPPAAGGVGAAIGDHPLMPQLMYKTEGTAIGRGRDSVERIFAFTQLPQTGAKILIAIAREDIVGAQERAANRQLAMLMAVAASTLVAAWLIAEFSVLRWVRVLGRAADAFGRGDLGHRAVVSPAAGEFAALAETLNRMAATVATRTAALATSERRFRDIAEVAGDFFWERDADGHYTFLSERFSEVTGIPAVEIVEGREGGDISLAPGSDDAPRLRSALARRQPFRNLLMCATLPTGEARWWRVSGTPFFDAASGAFLGFRGAGSEVTAAKRVEDELRIAIEAAEAASRAKSEFLATMSHELRTPLNAVIGFSEIMSSELLGPIGSDAYRDYAGDILHSGQHLLAMINDILDFAKIDAGKLHLVEDNVDLVGLARSAIRVVEPQAQAQGVSVALTGAATGLAVRGDERRLRQVLLNLVSNAVKFTARGGTVELELCRTPSGEPQMIVRDTGIGIAEEDLPHVIEPFRQADSGHARRHDGTGLGLAICDRLVRLHGGSLSITSRLGAGTAATVTLPAERSLAA